MNGSTPLDVAFKAVEDMKVKSRWLHDNAPVDVMHAYPAPSGTAALPKPFPNPADKRSILAAWQRPKHEPEGKTNTPYEAPRSLWLLLSDLYGAFCRKQETEPLSDRDKAYIFNAFAYAKLADREFEKTSLLRKYASLIQGF